ncbi:acyl-CoA dehydrogenase family protein [Streptomyces sp. Rer75]|uniref:acyl-CoA dehydrogenase family protein n=1 Tax=Streptomyces sp. Rer75 TaxID=2750011 RepID=UPI00211EA5FF|nr:acyl-CoA dehydrogenase family protein [Streptomyces sp. Rer75]
MTSQTQQANMAHAFDQGHRTLEAEVEQIRSEARRRFGGFVLETVNPGAYFRERDWRLVDKHLLARAAEIGLLQFSLPAHVGGAGRDKFEWGVVVEELARLSLDPGFSVLVDTTVEIAEVLLSSDGQELIERYVPDLVAGRLFVALGAYESKDPYDYESTARLEGEEWVLNGTKHFVTGGLAADLFVMFVRDEASNDVLAFVVEKDDPGVAVIPLETMGLRTMGLAQVVLHDVRVPGWRQVWHADALSRFNTYARGRRIMTACGITGALQGVVENCIEALSSRRRSGRRVLDYPNVERSIGEMRMLLEASRATVHRALDGTRSPDRDAFFDEFATVAKHHAAESAVRIGQLVMNLQGGEGYISTFPWERFMRNVLGMIGGQGSQELLLMQLGQRTIVGLEGKRVREDAAELSVAKLADSWWALHAAEAVVEDPAGEFAEAAWSVVSAAELESTGMDPDRHSELVAFLDRAHAMAEAVRSGQAPDAMPRGPEGLFHGRLEGVAWVAWSWLACAIAQETGLLARLLRPCTVKEAAADLPEDFTRDLLKVLAGASLVQTDTHGRYTIDQRLEQVLIGGPRTSAFATRLRRALARAAQLRTGKPAAGRELMAGCGDDSPALGDVLVNSSLGRLEGLADLLVTPGARVGCAAGDGGRSAVALARNIPFASILALEPRQPAPNATGDVLVETRACDLDGFEEHDRLALAWLPTAGLPTAGLRRAITACAAALVPGGWIVLPNPLPPKHPIGAAAARLELELAGWTGPAEGDVEALLKEAGLGLVRTVWEDAVLGIRLTAARRP